MIYVDTSSLLKLAVQDPRTDATRRLMTHDDRQARAARELGYAVEMPGLE